MRQVLLVGLMLMCVSAWAQQPSAPPPSETKAESQKEEPKKEEGKPQEAKEVAVPPASYEFSAEDKGKIRELQYAVDQLEIENQKMQVKIEQNKAQQAALLNNIKQIAFDLSIKDKIDLSKYELDLRGVRFRKTATQ